MTKLNSCSVHHDSAHLQTRVQHIPRWQVWWFILLSLLFPQPVIYLPVARGSPSSRALSRPKLWACNA